MVRDHARHRGLSSAEWARAAFGPSPPSAVFQVGGASGSGLGSDPMAMANQATQAGQGSQRVQEIDRGLARHMSGLDPRTPPELGRLSAERRRLAGSPGAPATRTKARGAPPTPKRRSRHDTPERRRQPGVAPRPQTFDISGAIPPEMRPANFRQLEDDKMEIIQYLVNTQGFSRAEADQVISDLEVDLMNSAG